MLRELGDAIGRSDEGERLAQATENALAGQPSAEAPGPRVTPMIWHEPLMAVGPRRYAGALLETMGWTVPDLEPEGNGYPVVTPELLVEHRIEGLLLSSEPHAFALEEGEAIADAVEALGAPRPWCRLIDGEALTWFGSRTHRSFEGTELSV
jgi:hypothetical protein